MTTTNDTFVEPAADARFRQEATGDVVTYAELVAHIDPELRPSDEADYQHFLNILDVTPLD